MQEDKFSLEERTKLIGCFLDKEEFIEVPGFTDQFGKIRFNKTMNKPTCTKIKLLGKYKIIGAELGNLDITFVVPLTYDVRVIDVRLSVNYQHELISDKVCLTMQEFENCFSIRKPQHIHLENLKDYSKNLAYNFSKVCYDKTMEFYQELFRL